VEASILASLIRNKLPDAVRGDHCHVVRVLGMGGRPTRSHMKEQDFKCGWLYAHCRILRTLPPLRKS